MTGDGPSVDHKFHLIFSKILEIITLSAEGHESRFDSDATFQGIPANSENPEVISCSLADNSELTAVK